MPFTIIYVGVSAIACLSILWECSEFFGCCKRAEFACFWSFRSRKGIFPIWMHVSLFIIWYMIKWNMKPWLFSQDTFEAKVVDCVLALKSLHELKQMNNGNGFHKHVKSPLVLHSASRMHPRPLSTVSLDSCRRLDMSAMCEKQPPVGSKNAELEGLSNPSYNLCLYCTTLVLKLTRRCTWRW